MPKMLIWIALVLQLCLIQGCVTTTSQAPINTEKAHETRIRLGMSYLDQGMRDNARYQFSKALKLKKNSSQGFHGIALVHLANGELEPAKESFKKALRYGNEEELAGIRVSYGKYLMSVGNHEEACEYFENAAADYEYSGRAQALYLAGQCAAKNGNKARQKSAFEHALNLNANLPPVLIELAEIYFEEGQYAKAKNRLDRLESLTKPTSRSLWLSIRIERIFGNRDNEASLVLALKNMFPYSKEYLEYKQLMDQAR